MEHKKKVLLFAFLTLILVIPMAPTASATWQTNGNPICTVTGQQYYPQMIDAGNGSFIITWQDPRNDGNDIYAQKINSTGHIKWTADGVPVCTATSYQTLPKMCSDGAGGAIITWSDRRNVTGTEDDIYAQRLNSTGHPQWDPNGTIICNAVDDQMYPEIIASDSNTAIIGWMDKRTGSGDVYAQKVNASGGGEWGPNGTGICTTIDGQSGPSICTDGAGGAIMVWTDNRGVGTSDLYAQKVNSAGSAQWTADGVSVVNASYRQWIPEIVSDSLGGAIIAWWDEREDPSQNYQDIYVQQLDPSGNQQWDANGTLILNSTFQVYPDFDMIPDGSNGVFIVWETNLGFTDIYANRLNAAGTKLWGNNGKVIASNSGYYERDPRLCSDGAGGIIVAWEDGRITDLNIYAQRLTSSGTLLWCATGVEVTTATGWEDEIRLHNISAGNAIAVWQDKRNGSQFDIYAGYVTADYCPGNGGDPPIPGFALLYIVLGFLTIIALYREKLKIKK